MECYFIYITKQRYTVFECDIRVCLTDTLAHIVTPGTLCSR